MSPKSFGKLPRVQVQTNRDQNEIQGNPGKGIAGRILRRRQRLVDNAVLPLEKRMLYSTTVFTPGDLAVEVMGVANTTLSSTVSTVVSVQEFNTFAQGQSPAITITLPTANGSGATLNALTDLSTTGSTAGGFMTRSTDGRYLVLEGYNAGTGVASGLLAQTSQGVPSTYPRTIALINVSGGVNTTTSFGGAANPINNVSPRGVISNDGNEFWVSGGGATGGVSPVQYVSGLGQTTATQVASVSTGSDTNLKADGVYGGQLYVSSGTNPVYGEGTIGNINAGASEPTAFINSSTGQPTYVLPAMAGNPGSGGAFVFANSTTLYNADPSGGMQKWSYVQGQWVLDYETPVPATSSSDSSLQGLTMDPNGLLYGTTTAPSVNRLVQITDTGSAFSFVTLATAQTGQVFKGVALTPAGAGIYNITASPASVGSSGTFNLSAQAYTTELSSPGTVSSVQFFEQPAVNASAGSQSISDNYVGAGVYNSSTNTWNLNNVNINPYYLAANSSAGTYSFYAIAAESGGAGLYPNAVTHNGLNYNSGVGVGVGIEPTASILLAANPTPAVGSVTVAAPGTVAFDGSIAITANNVSPAPGDTGLNTNVYFEAVGGGKTYGLGFANSSTGYTLTYSPDVTTIANSSGGTLSGLPAGNGYNIIAYAQSSLGQQSVQVQATDALTVTVPAISFNQSTYIVATPTPAQLPTSVTIYFLRTGNLADTVTVNYNTSNTGVGGGQTQAIAGSFFGTQGNTAQVTGTVTFASGSNISNPVTIPLLAPLNQLSTGVFTVAMNTSTATVTAGANNVSTGATVGSNAKVDMTVTAETFNFSSPTFVVDKGNTYDSTGLMTFSVTRSGYAGDAATLNVSTYALTTASVWQGLVKTASGTSVGNNASAGTDYTALTNASISFAANQSVGTFQVPYNINSANTNVSFGVVISAPQGGLNGTTAGSAYLLGSGTNIATGTILTPTLGNNLSGVPGTATDVETTTQYTAAALPLVGDNSGSGNFGYLDYEMLEFSPSVTPTIYPPIGTNLSAGAISNLSLSLFNFDNTPGDEYNGQSGDFNLYYIADSDNTQPTAGLNFNNIPISSPTGFSWPTTSGHVAPYFLGSFTFSDNAGYQTVTVVPSSANSFSTAATALITALNSGSNFRLALTPAAQGRGGIQAEWDGLNSSEPPMLALTATTNTTASPEYFSFSQTGYTVNQNAGTATITIQRSTTAGGAPVGIMDTATVYFNASTGSAVPGQDYTPVTESVTFNSGTGSVVVTIPIDPNGQVVTQGGDKQVNLSLSSPSNGSGYAAGLGTTPTSILTIQDNKDQPGQNTSFQTLTYVSDVASVVEAQGPYDINHFSADGINGSLGYAEYGAASFNDGQIVQIGANSVSNTVLPANTITSINDISLQVYNLGGGGSGPVDVYLFTNSNSNIYPSTLPGAGSYYNPAAFQYADPHFFNFQYTEGLDHSPADQQGFGTPLLLGSLNWSSTNVAGLTTIPLSGYSYATEQALWMDLNSGLPFQIVVTPESNTVYAGWAGSGVYTTDAQGNVVTESPHLVLNVTESLPTWLKPGSVATWNASTQSLVVSGPATIWGDPGTDEPNITFTGSGDVLTIQPNVSSGAFSAFHVGSLNISNGAHVNVVAGSVGSDVLIVAAPNVSTGTPGFFTDNSGKLDLGSNDMILQGQAGSLSTINTEIGLGFNNGAWNGTTGITSSAAANDPSHLAALGAISNANGLFASTFDGIGVTNSDLLVKYTFYGDANLSGHVDGSDYSLIDSTYLQEQSPPHNIGGWINGDFNYDGVVNGSDYTLIDNAYNIQGLAVSPLAVIASQIAGIPPVTQSTMSLDSFFSRKKAPSSLADDVDGLIAG